MRDHLKWSDKSDDIIQDAPLSQRWRPWARCEKLCQIFYRQPFVPRLSCPPYVTPMRVTPA